MERHTVSDDIWLEQQIHNPGVDAMPFIGRDFVATMLPKFHPSFRTCICKAYIDKGLNDKESDAWCDAMSDKELDAWYDAVGNDGFLALFVVGCKIHSTAHVCTCACIWSYKGGCLA